MNDNEELFRPVLTEDDDVAGIDRPWNPLNLVFFTFFFGILSGGPLLAWNFKRLGRQNYFVPVLVFSFILGILFVAVAAWAGESGWVSRDDKDRKFFLRTILRAVSVFVTYLIARKQKARYRLFQMTGQPGGKLLLPAVAAAIVGLALQFGLVIAVLFLIRVVR